MAKNGSDSAQAGREATAGAVTAREARLTRILPLLAAVVLIGAGAGLAAHLARLHGPLNPAGKPIGGDFICFYQAARLIVSGCGAQLYDPLAQRQVQREILGPKSTKFGAYQYPPTLAIAQAPLALLPMQNAYAIYTLLQIAAVIAALRVLREDVPLVARRFWTLLGAAISFGPLFIGITSGQNVAMSLLLMALLYRALRRERDFSAGCWLGLLAFKPQLALLLGVLLLPKARFRVIGVAAGVGVVHYAIGALVVGWDWPSQMLELVGFYWPYERMNNGKHAISLVAICEHLWDHPLARPAGFALALGIAAGYLGYWRRTSFHRPEFAIAFAGAIAATLLCSPHTQWYDAGLLILSAILVINWRIETGWALKPVECAALAGAFLLPLAVLAQDNLGIHPVTLLPLAMLYWVDRRARPAADACGPAYLSFRTAKRRAPDVHG